MPEPIDEHADPERSLTDREVALRVRQAIADLPIGQRSAAMLVYLGGLTHAEVAEVLGIRPGAVKTRLHKARARLRRDLFSLWEDGMTDEPSTLSLDGNEIAARVADVRRSADGQLWVIVRDSSGGRECWIAVERQVDADLATALAVALQRQRLPAWLCDEVVRGRGEGAFIRRAPRVPPRWIDGSLCDVRVIIRDGELTAVLQIEAADGGSTEALEMVAPALLRSLVIGVPLSVDERVFGEFSSTRLRANGTSDPFSAASVGASTLADEILKRWQGWRDHGPEWVALELVDVFVVNASSDQRRHVAILKETRGSRFLTIWVGQQEGAALAVLLAGVETPRPFSIVTMGRLLSAARRAGPRSAHQPHRRPDLLRGNRGRPGLRVSRHSTHDLATLWASRSNCTLLSSSPPRSWNSPLSTISTCPNRRAPHVFRRRC